jgi:hypothetical protein
MEYMPIEQLLRQLENAAKHRVYAEWNRSNADTEYERTYHTEQIVEAEKDIAAYKAEIVRRMEKDTR